MNDLPKPFGRYLLLKLLGAGGGGDAHLARSLDRAKKLPSPLVIKRLHARLEEDENFVSRFEHEARLAVEIESPVLARVYEVGRVGSALYMAQEYVEGFALSNVLTSIRSTNKKINFASAIEFTARLLDGLHLFHEARDPRTKTPLSAVHRDISPKNIMVDERGQVRLIDLGLGKSALQEWRTRTGMIMGTMGYMPPEQIAGSDVDRRADIYSVAAVLYELLTLEPYVERGPLMKMVNATLTPKYRPITEHRPECPPELDIILCRALAVDPEERLSSAKELADALRKTAPARSEGESLAEIVRALFGDGLQDSRTEVTRLLSATALAPKPLEEDELVVYAEYAQIRVHPARLALGKLLPLIILLPAVLSAAIAYLWMSSERVEYLKDAPEKNEPVIPQVTARPAEKKVIPRVDPPPLAPVRETKISPKKAVSVLKDMSPEPIEAPVIELSAKERARALIGRTKLLKNRFPSSGVEAQQLDKILARLVLEAGAADETRALENLKRLEAELKSFEAR